MPEVLSERVVNGRASCQRAAKGSAENQLLLRIDRRADWGQGDEACASAVVYGVATGGQRAELYRVHMAPTPARKFAKDAQGNVVPGDPYDYTYCRLWLPPWAVGVDVDIETTKRLRLAVDASFDDQGRSPSLGAPPNSVAKDVSGITSQQNSSGYSISSIVIGNNANRCLYAFGAVGDSTSTRVVSSVTWNSSEGLTKQTTVDGWSSLLELTMWRRVAPTATTAALAIAANGSASGLGLAYFAAYNVDQTTPNGTVTTETNTDLSINTTGVTDGMSVGALEIGDTGGNTITGVNQTSEGINSFADGIGDMAFASATGTGTITFTWTTGSGAPEGGAKLAFTVNPAATGLDMTGSAASVTVSAGTGALAPSGAAPMAGTAASVNVAPPNGALSGTGVAAMAGSAASVMVTVPNGALAPGVSAMAGSAASVTVSVPTGALTSGAGSMAGSPASVTVSVPNGALAPTGAATMAGAAASVTVAAGTGALTGTGTAALAGSAASVTVTAGTGTLKILLLGSPATVTVTVPNGALAGTGVASMAGSAASVTVTVPTGSLSGSGTAAMAGSASSVTVSVPTGAMSVGAIPMPGTAAVVNVTVPNGALAATGAAPLAGTAAVINVLPPTGVLSGTGVADPMLGSAAIVVVTTPEGQLVSVGFIEADLAPKAIYLGLAPRATYLPKAPAGTYLRLAPKANAE